MRIDMDYPEDSGEFERAWSMAAGERSTMMAVVVEIDRRAGEEFIAKRDSVAQSFRNLADHFRQKANELDKRLQGYIDESRRRRVMLAKLTG